MSRYMKLETEFTNAESLLKALTDLGITFERSRDLKVNSLTMKNRWMHGDEKAAIVLNKSGYWGQIGFAWDGRKYSLIQDGMDNNTGTINQVRQHYALHEIRRQARVKGYQVREQQQADGSIRLQLIHY